MAVLIVVLIVVLGACSGTASPPAVAALPAAALTPPTLRLPDDVRPVHATLELTLDPAAPDFTGEETIELQLSRSTRILWLNAEHLEVSVAEITAGGHTGTARVVPGGDDFVGFALPAAVGPGPATLHLRWKGTLAAQDATGAYLEKEGPDSYIYSQFESTYARRVFPGFDEPGDKHPWRLTLRVPKDLVAVSNTPVESETADGVWKRVVFGETRPLPSYLVAFAVGPFEVLDAGHTKSGIPLRVVVPRGLAGQAGTARTTLGPIVDELEHFLGTPYPYAKLDLVGTRHLQGAMENAGMITSATGLILRRPAEEDIGFRRGFVSLIAHEAGHQWFGDLVTTAWWDDIWLNEAFASWVEVRVAEEMHPEWHAFAQALQLRGIGLNADARITSRKIRQPIESKGDIGNAFDGITYDKGASVLRMFESWVGTDAFRRGLATYFAAHADKNATAADFVAAMSRGAGRDLAPAFAGFLDAPGAPEIAISLACPAGGPPRAHLAQKRYLPLGSKGETSQTWKVPVCMRWAAGKSPGSACHLMEGAEEDVTLEGATGCPDFLVGNVDSAGYYMTLYEPELLTRLQTHFDRLSEPEKLALLGDLRYLVVAGRVSPRATLTLAAKLSQDRDPLVLRAAADLADFEYLYAIPPDLRPAYQAFVVATFGPRARALGWHARKGDDDDTRLLRDTLLGLVADTGGESKLVAEARGQAEKWLAGDSAALDAELVETVLTTAAHHGDRALFDKARARLRTSTDATDRYRVLTMLASFRVPELVDEVLALQLSPEVDPREHFALDRLKYDRVNGARSYAFLRDHFDALLARMPEGDFSVNAMAFVGGFCDAAAAVTIEHELGERERALKGGARVFAQSIERIELCAAARKFQEPEVSAFLKQRTR